ncbi:hypothetical protein [Pseudomonas sp. VE 196-7]|uniref:hypothetical protein n=1 Tax=Pseudomonas sp. VE 196-7 TaxID=2956726 RepID=UPI0021D4EAA8|nr:hypothetical protein [Pseudomonas sp. VE 196-7]MCU7217550.1 hypothetical protein [Pseudomonas sp. VE 196-7]
MEAFSPSVWFPVVTLVVGVLLKAVFDAWTENRKSALDKMLRVEKRKEIILMQRIDLQRKALGDLQVALSDLIRSTNLIHLHDAKMYREGSEWGVESTPDGLGETIRNNFRSVTLTRVRVSDEGVRKLAGDLSALCTQVTLSRTEDQADEAMRSSSVLYSSINEKIGEALRSLEHEEQALLI